MNPSMNPFAADSGVDCELLHQTVKAALERLRANKLNTEARYTVATEALTAICTLNVYQQDLDTGFYCCFADALLSAGSSPYPSVRNASYHTFWLALIAASGIAFPEDALDLIYGVSYRFELPEADWDRFVALACLRDVVDRKLYWYRQSLSEHFSLITIGSAAPKQGLHAKITRMTLEKWNIVPVGGWSRSDSEHADV